MKIVLLIRSVLPRVLLTYRKLTQPRADMPLCVGRAVTRQMCQHENDPAALCGLCANSGILE